MKKAYKVLALLLAMAMILTACNSNTTSTEDKKQDVAKTQESQPFRLGVILSPTDTLDPVTVMSPGGMVLMFNIYDSLARVTDKGTQLSLAESIEPNATADEFTIVLKKGIKFSDGTDMKAEDVLASLKYIATSLSYQSIYGSVDFDKSTANDNTLVISLKEPTADFITSSLGMISVVAPKGVFNGIGAGPYIVDKGDSTTGYVLKANSNYFAGKPAIPELSIVPIADSQSQVNALINNEIDYAFGLDNTALQTLKSNEDIVLPESHYDSATIKVLTLNTRVAPFNDPEVRKAAKLTVDRDKLVNVLLGSSGVVGNDILGMGYPSYSKNIPQTTVNKEEAKKIFANKGVTEFTIITSDIVPGLVASAELMVQEFAEVGVKVSIQQMEPQTFFSQMPKLYESSAFTFYWVNRAPLTEFRSQVLKDSPYNMSGYFSDVTESNFKIASSSIDEKVQQEAIDKVNQDVHDNGGDLIWGYQLNQAAHRKGLENIEIFQSIPWIAGSTFTPQAQK